MAQAEAELMTVAEAGEYLGIAPKAIYSLEKAGWITGQRKPHTRPTLFLHRASVEAYRQGRDARKQVRDERGRPLTNAERLRNMRQRQKERATASAAQN
jgi:hypothetical protein